MIYDCFSFFNELDLLEIRLTTLDKVVNKFVLVESHYTHTGQPKPLYYAENINRFSKFNEKIIHIIADDFPDIPGATYREMAWIRENWQRNAILRGLPKDVKDNDYLIIADLDEIPRPDAILDAVNYDGVSHLYLSMFYYFVNCKDYSNPIWMRGPQVLPFKTFHNSPPPPERLNFPIDWHANKGMTPSVIRFLKPTHIIKHAGWHFSFCGGSDSIKHKLSAVAPHSDSEALRNKTIDKNAITSTVLDGKDIYGRNYYRYFAVALDNSFPVALLRNQKKFRNLIYPTTFIYKVNTFFPRIMAHAYSPTIAILRLILPRKLKDFLYIRFFGA